MFNYYTLKISVKKILHNLSVSELNPYLFLTVLPEFGMIAPALKPGRVSPKGYPAFHCTLMSPNSPFRVTFATQIPVSTLETCRASEAKPTYRT